MSADDPTLTILKPKGGAGRPRTLDGPGVPVMTWLSVREHAELSRQVRQRNDRSMSAEVRVAVLEHLDKGGTHR